jgi:hypothetical protein
LKSTKSCETWTIWEELIQRGSEKCRVMIVGP